MKKKKKKIIRLISLRVHHIGQNPKSQPSKFFFSFFLYSNIVTRFFFCFLVTYIDKNLIITYNKF